MDGVPGLSFAGIAPGKTFVYRIPVVQNGTYWYHSHYGGQEQVGLYGGLIIEPRDEDPIAYDRDYAVLLSDWTDTSPETVYSNLKKQSDYYNFHKRTAGTFVQDIKSKGLGSTVRDRLMWGRMDMNPTDIADVTSATYIYLTNGNPPGANWTALFNPGERVRLRFINASSMTIFDVRIPGLPMTVAQADGNCVQPVAVCRSSHYAWNSASSVRRSVARGSYDRQGVLCPVDLVPLTEKCIRVNPDSTKTLKVRLVAEVIRGLTCHAAARHMPSRLGCVKHVHNA